MMVTTSSDACLTVLLIAITIYLSESVSPNVGAPDSNNLNMEFTPDDSVAGGIDTSLDNTNATPLTFTTVLTTTQPTTTTTTTVTPKTTSLKAVFQTAETRRRFSTTTKLMTPKPLSTTTSAINVRRIIEMTTAAKAVSSKQDLLIYPDVSGQNKYNLPENARRNPYYNPRVGPQVNGWTHDQNGYYPYAHSNQGRQSNGRVNLPWWMLLLAEA